MSKKKKSNISIKGILQGKFLVEKGSFRNWKFVIFMVALGFISIGSSHWADKRVLEIKQLQKEVADLKSEYADIHKSLMNTQMESTIIEKVAGEGIVKATKQPYKLTSYDKQ